MLYKKNRGFTLVELLVVIIIIGILAALTFPQFTKTKERALGKEAQATLKLIAAAEKIYRMGAGAYYPLVPPNPQTNIGPINTNLRLSITDANWDYAVNSSTNVSTATRTSGPSSGCTYTINFTADELTNVNCP